MSELHQQNRQGYIALTAVLVIAAVVLLLAVTVSTLSVGQLQTSLSSLRSTSSFGFIESCVDYALIRLNEDADIPDNFTINGNTCNVVIENQSDTRWTFLVSGTVDDYAKSVRITADRTDRVYIVSWQQVQ